MAIFNTNCEGVVMTEMALETKDIKIHNSVQSTARLSSLYIWHSSQPRRFREIEVLLFICLYPGSVVDSIGSMILCQGGALQRMDDIYLGRRDHGVHTLDGQTRNGRANDGNMCNCGWTGTCGTLLLVSF